MNGDSASSWKTYQGIYIWVDLFLSPSHFLKSSNFFWSIENSISLEPELFSPTLFLIETSANQQHFRINRIKAILSRTSPNQHIYTKSRTYTPANTRYFNKYLFFGSQCVLQMLKMWQCSSDADRTTANTFQISVITGGFILVCHNSFYFNTKYTATVLIFLCTHAKSWDLLSNHHNNIHPFVVVVSIHLLRSLRVQFINSGQRFVTTFFVFYLKKILNWTFVKKECTWFY